jgi:hypothetical protein
LARAAFQASGPVFVVVVLLVAAELVKATFTVWWIGAALVAYVAADLLVGLLHFFADNFGRLDTTFGQTFIQRFRDHHVEPEELAVEPLAEAVGPTLLFTSPTLLLAYLVTDSSLALWFWFVLCVTAGLSNLVHRWAHQEQPYLLVRVLQDWKIILNPVQHDKHHLLPNSHFCVLAGWFDDWFRVHDVPNRLRQRLVTLGLRRS